MKLRTVYAILPYLLIHVEDKGQWWAGRANGPVVRIKETYREDRGLRMHEEEHVRQWYMTLGLHGLLYKFSRRYRAWSEAKAYAMQVIRGADVNRMARAMANSDNYDLDLTVAEAKGMIEDHL